MCSRALRGSNSHHPIESRRSRPLDEGRMELVSGIEPQPGALRKRCSALELHQRGADGGTRTLGTQHTKTGLHPFAASARSSRGGNRTHSVFRRTVNSRLPCHSVHPRMCAENHVALRAFTSTNRRGCPRRRASRAKSFQVFKERAPRARWFGLSESNAHSRSQSPVSCHWTKPNHFS